ncbi:hypothetical protein U1Q18_012601 [Sarracenia purpurea var. burkii]
MNMKEIISFEKIASSFLGLLVSVLYIIAKLREKDMAQNSVGSGFGLLPHLFRLHSSIQVSNYRCSWVCCFLHTHTHVCICANHRDFGYYCYHYSVACDLECAGGTVQGQIAWVLV